MTDDTINTIYLYRVDENINSILPLLLLDKCNYDYNFNKAVIELYYEPFLINKHWDDLQYDDLNHHLKHNHIFKLPVAYNDTNPYYKRYFGYFGVLELLNSPVIDRSHALSSAEKLIDMIIKSFDDFLQLSVYLAFDN